MNKDAVVTMFLGLSAFSKKRIGLRKIPPPIPTIPEIRPKKDPIKIEKKKLSFFIVISLSSYDLFFINNNKPARDKTINNIISKRSFSIFSVPPIKASGIEPIKKGINNLKL